MGRPGADRHPPGRRRARADRGHAAPIEADMAVAERLAGLVTGAADLELWPRPVIGVVNGRPLDKDPLRFAPGYEGRESASPTSPGRAGSAPGGQPPGRSSARR